MLSKPFMVITKIFGLIFMVMFLVPSILNGASSVSAQVNPTWSPPQRIPGYENSTWTPILITDSNGTVHSFSYQWMTTEKGDSQRVIMYNRWTMEQGWTAPVDILKSPFKNDARLLDVFIDQTSKAHVLFWGGDNTEASIYHSSAPIANAGNARAWSEPNLVADNAGDPDTGMGAVDEQGRIYFLYNGRFGNGIYSTISENDGVTWAKPTPIYQTFDINRVPQALHLYKGQSGLIHAVWNVITGDGQGRGIYYSQIELGDTHWSNPILLAEEQTGYGTNTPAVIEYQGDIFAIYNMTPKIMMRLSKDRGQTWRDPVGLFPRQVGVSGNLSLVIDGMDTLRLFFIQRIPGITLGPNQPDIGGVWQSIWRNGRWMEPEAVAVRTTDPNAKGNDLFAPYEARAIVSSGNTLLVTWMTDPGFTERNGVWYSYALIEAPNFTLEPQPTVSPVLSTSEPLLLFSTPQGTPTLSSIPGTSNQIVNSQVDYLPNEKPGSNNSSLPLLVSIVLAILFIIAVGFYILKSGKR